MSGQNNTTYIDLHSSSFQNLEDSFRCYFSICLLWQYSSFYKKAKEGWYSYITYYIVGLQVVTEYASCNEDTTKKNSQSHVLLSSSIQHSWADFSQLFAFKTALALGGTQRTTMAERMKNSANNNVCVHGYMFSSNFFRYQLSFFTSLINPGPGVQGHSI